MKRGVCVCVWAMLPMCAAAQSTLESGATASAFRLDDEARPGFLQPEDDAGEDVPFFASVHSGAYARVSGLVVEQFNDIREIDTGEAIGFDTGGGVSIAGGFRDFRLPLAIEIEYAYRGVSASTDETSLDLHTLGANVLFDASDLAGPVGLYAGVGIGFRISELHVRSHSGSTAVGIEGDGFFWQAMGGVTVSVAREVQLFAGVRYSDAGTLQNDEFRVNSEALNYEFGLRFFF